MQEPSGKVYAQRAHAAAGFFEKERIVEEGRFSYLDNLRVSLVALVICHHANAAYGSPGGWDYIVHEHGGTVTEILTTMFAGVTQAFFMSSFFLISAYFTAPAYDHKGAWSFARRRLVRLGIPLLVYYYVLSLLMHYMILTFKGRTEEGLLTFFSGHFLHYGEPGPLWFALALLIFEGVYIAFRKIAGNLNRPPRSYPLPSDRQILLFIVGIGFFTFLFRQWHPLTVHLFHLRLAFFPLYVCMFVFGIITYRSGWFRLLTAQQANRWFIVSLVAIAIVPIIMVVNAALGYDAYKFWGGFNWQNYSYSAWEPFLCVGINMKLIVLFRDRFDFSTAFTKSMAKSSYTAYIFHAFFVVIATYLFTFFSLGRIPEIILMWPVAVIPCFLFADMVRRLPLLKKVL
jgi:peptidoglycan/LPS O-acetylase OafA/YrhL